MRNSITHLPAVHQRQILEIVNIILGIVQPDKIILFGSYAKGSYVEHRYTGKDGILYEYISDYDLLVVVPELNEKEFVIEERIGQETRYFHHAVNVIVHNLAFVNQSLAEGWYFFNEIVQEGILLYDASELPLATPVALTAEQKQLHNSRNYRKYMERVGEYRAAAAGAFERGALNHAIFCLHQAVECLYYTVLLVHSNYKPKTHQLTRLRQRTKNYSKSLYFLFNEKGSGEDRRLFNLLNRAYIDARYKDDFEVSAADVLTLRQKLDDMIQVVKESCRDLIGEEAE